MLLQVLDDGRLTDSHGRTVSFKNTVVIMTSNAPKETLGEIFRPEFLNRLDEVLEFDSLGKNEIREIVKLQIADFAKRLADNQLALKIDDAALDLIAERGYDPQFGARPVKRTIQRELENPVAKAIVAGRYPPGATVSIAIEDGNVVLT
jgi:ATP-dependent Clp protease ATP-binding subunit ClpB